MNFVLTAPWHTCHLLFCPLQKWQLLFVSQVLFLLLLVTPPSYMVSITQHQQNAEQEKFCGLTVNSANSFVNGELVAFTFIKSNTILVPLIVDPFGGLDRI